MNRLNRINSKPLRLPFTTKTKPCLTCNHIEQYHIHQPEGLAKSCWYGWSSIDLANNCQCEQFDDNDLDKFVRETRNTQLQLIEVDPKTST